ncbi:MAG: DNA internalization-related competence protein ComEC/Rec2 [Planctomyces sp.]|nr:DNA internalization-related competence protein ComEC/Rec2 [Planctomyces sp.]
MSSTPPPVLSPPALLQQLLHFLRQNPLLLPLLPYAAGVYLWEQVGPASSILPVAILWLLALAGWIYALRRQWGAGTRGLLCLLCFLFGMLRLYDAYLPASPDDISGMLAEERRLVRVEGRLTSSPVVKQKSVNETAPDWQRVPATNGHLAIERIQANGNWYPLTGKVWLTIRGDGLTAERGDRIAATGWLEAPFTTSNPGEFDFRTWLRHEGITGVLRVKETESIDVLATPRAQSRPETDWTNQIRRRWKAFASEHLTEENQSLAAAMILGVRDDIVPDQIEQFTQTGTMHFLAVSGLHVGILVLFLFGAGRLVGIPTFWLPHIVLIVIWLYAFITDMNPPVMRASLLATFLFLGRILIRRSSLLNLLALAGLVLLVIDPRMLFNVGAQLSFLAVGGIIWGATTFPLTKNRAPVESGRLSWTMHWTGNYLKSLTQLTFAIWLFTAPIVLALFHFIAPIGLLINVLLSPLVLFMLWAGYLMSIAIYVFPPLAILLAYPFDFLLSLFRLIIEQAHASGWGTWYAPAPPLWFFILYYLGLAIFTLGRRAPFHYARWRWPAGGAVFVLAFALLAIPTPTSGLTVTVFNVGHGSAVLIEYPNGRRMLYDCGSIDGGNHAARAVENSLWNEGKHGIDSLVISHADVDHFNGAMDLFDKIPVASVCCSPQFLDFGQAAVNELITKLDANQIPFSLLQAEDSLLIDPEVVTKVLYPDSETRLNQDNDHSLVLLLEYAGRRILLTGDLELEGQEHLQYLLQKRLPVDLLTAPHHGAREANGTLLYEQFSPRFVTVSSSHYAPDSEEEWRERLPDGEAVFHTRKHGAVRFVINAEGQMTATPFLAEEPRLSP